MAVAAYARLEPFRAVGGKRHHVAEFTHMYPPPPMTQDRMCVMHTVYDDVTLCMMM